MNANDPISEVRVEFFDHSEQPFLGGYISPVTAPVPAVGDTFQGGSPTNVELNATYVVERRHFFITSGSLVVRIYARDVQVTGGL